MNNYHTLMHPVFDRYDILEQQQACNFAGITRKGFGGLVVAIQTVL
jgi:hypothetical protein